MSSDEDDDEELLQRALAQQAQHDQAFRRPVLPSPGLSGVPPPAHFNPPQHPPPQYPPPQHPPPQHPPPQHPPPQHPPPPKYAPPAAPVVSQGAAAAAAEESGPPRRAPPRTPPNRAPPPAPAPAMDEDEEESDVEMLSISSDDDTPPPTRRDSKQRDAAKAGKRGDDESDLEWNEDDREPENWKNVDQAELVRRVREMREAKVKTSAPPVTRLRRTTTIADASRAEDLLDPLNLGVINIKTLTLVKEKREGFQNEKNNSSELQAPQDEPPVVRDSALREKIMYHSESFDPKFFLAHVHQNTSSSDLEAGEGALRTNLQNCKDQLKKLVKENFDCFISCKNTIDDIHSKLQQIEDDPEGAGTVHLSEAIQSVDVVAKKAFGPLLERQAQAERIRSVQGMLQRFRTLFNLPSIIRGNISKGEYDLAIREYKKAKSLVQYTHVGILSRVLEEVDKIVLEFKDMLYKTMEDPNVDTPQLENTIRLLLELEPDSDPIWYYLSIQDRRIRGLLEGCSLEHETRMDALQGRLQEKVQSDARWKQLQRESNRAADVDFNILLGEQDKDVGDGSLRDSTVEEADALLGRLVRRLTAVFVQHVPNFWRLALLIFSGKFVKVSQPGPANGRPLPSNSNEVVMYPFETQAAVQHSKHTMDEVVTMVLTIVSLYETKVLNTFNALAEAKVHRSHMRDALVEITKASVALQGKDCAPPSAVQALLALRIDVTRIFVLRLCTLIRGATPEFVNEEDWVPVPTTERGGTPCSISHLPLRFRNMLVAAMDNMSEMVQKLTGESAQLHEEQALIVYQMQDDMKNTFMECFLDLDDGLGKLASEISDQTQIQNSTGDGTGSGTVEDEFVGLVPGYEVLNLHQRMLMVLSNTAFCKSSLLPALSQKYESFWTHSRVDEMAQGESSTATTEEVNEALSVLEKNILEQFIKSKATEIKNAAIAYLVEDSTVWGQSPPTKGVRDNVVELIHPLVIVHAQVHSGAKLFLGEVVNASVEALIVALYDVFNDNKQKSIRLLDVNGYCQLTLELDFVDAVFERYFTPAAREAAVALRDMLLEKVCDSVREIHQAEAAAHSSSLRASRGNDEAMSLDRAGPMTPDEIQAHAHQVSAEYLPVELNRARTNVVCFTELVSEHTQLPRHAINLQKSGSARHLLPPAGPNYHHLRKSSGYLGGDSDIGRHSFSYAGSDAGSETSNRTSTSDRFRLPFDRSLHSESRRSLRTSSSKSYDTDLL